MKTDKMNRREFLRQGSAGALALGTMAVLPGCAARKQEDPETEKPLSGEMEYRQLNEDRVSLLGYGCMRWPMVKDAEGKDRVDQEKVNELVDYALAHGVNYFDTSPAYLQGQSERATGIALNRHPRSSYFLATKLSNFWDASREATLKMYRDSFREMGTDYFDYYLLHNIGRGGMEAFNRRYVDNGMMDFLLKEREAGRIRHLGFSFHGQKDAFDQILALHDKYHWDFVQIELNYIEWTHADGVRNTNADYLYGQIAAKGIPMVVMEPLLGGRLASVPANVLARMKERDKSAEPADWAFRFAGTPPMILTVLSGMTYMDHLQANVRTYTGFRPCSEEENAFLEQMAVLYKEYPLVNCTNCKYCMPCPYGLDIPGIFQHYNRAVNDGGFAQTKEQKDYARLKRAYLVSYSRAVPALRQADHCISCGQCLMHCPQSIPIPRELKRISDYIEKLKQDTL